MSTRSGATSRGKHCSLSHRYQIRGHIKGKTLLSFPQVPDQGPHQGENTAPFPTGTRSGAPSKGKHYSPSHRYQIRGHIKGKTLLPFPQVPDRGPHKGENTTPLPTATRSGATSKGRHCSPSHQVPDQPPHQRKDTAPRPTGNRPGATSRGKH